MDTTTAPTTLDTTTAGSPRRRRLGRLAAKAALVSGGLVAGLGGAAFAVAPFSDVPANHPFADEIEWAAEAGIANGYGDGTFRPGDPVSRGAMTAFLQRVWELQDTTYAATIVNSVTTTSTNWQNIPALVSKVTVPEGTDANLHAMFSAESVCHDGSGYCRVRIVAQKVGGGPVIELGPVTGSEFSFDTTDSNTKSSSSWEAHAIGRSTIDPLGPGEYNVGVQYSTSNGATFRLDDAALQVEADLIPQGELPIGLELG